MTVNQGLDGLYPIYFWDGCPILHVLNGYGLSLLQYLLGFYHHNQAIDHFQKGHCDCCRNQYYGVGSFGGQRSPHIWWPGFLWVNQSIIYCKISPHDKIEEKSYIPWRLSAVPRQMGWEVLSLLQLKGCVYSWDSLYLPKHIYQCLVKSSTFPYWSI